MGADYCVEKMKVISAGEVGLTYQLTRPPERSPDNRLSNSCRICRGCGDIVVKMSANDLDLLEQYARADSEDAFAALVQRHVDLVYSVALRRVRSAQLAEEITQSVFTDLARSAGKLRQRAVAGSDSLTPWLYSVTRRTAVDAIRRESRHRLREQIAVEMQSMNATADDWAQIEPLLEDAMGALNETDRAAVLLRYFENKSLREVGEVLGASEDAAQKRVSRALERLREFFSKRGVTVGASGLAVLISVHAVQSAPAGVATAVCAAAAFAEGAISTSTSATITAGKTIAMTTLEKTIIGAALVGAVGIGVYEAHRASELRAQNQALEQRQAALAGQVRQLQSERDDATNQLARLLANSMRSQSGSNETELLSLRGEVARMRKEQSGPTAAEEQGWLDRVHQLQLWAEQNPGATIPEFQLLTKQDWLNAARSELNSKTDYRRAMSSLRHAAESKFGNMLQMAVSKYMHANNGQFPTDLSQLEPDFFSQVDEAILQRWEIVPVTTVPGVGVGSPTVMTERAPVDELLDSRLVIGPYGTASRDWLGIEVDDTLRPVYQAYAQARGGDRSNLNPSDLLSFATTQQQRTAVQKLIEQKQLISAP
jgi:RNA polymerase sigma factor (sigma-70 family)